MKRETETHLDEATTVEKIPTHIKSSVLAESKSAQGVFKKNKKKFEKPLDKSISLWYNKDTKEGKR